MSLALDNVEITSRSCLPAYKKIYCQNCGALKVVRLGCGLRSCPDCSAKMRNRLYNEYMPLLSTIPFERLSMITLTLKINTESDLFSELKRLKKCWTKLLRRKDFQCVEGGLGRFEPKFSHKYNAWFLHLHLIVESQGRKVFKIGSKKKCDLWGRGKTLTFQKLGQLWKEITGDSYIADISPVEGGNKGISGALNYVLKYMLKVSEIPGDRVSEYDSALFKTRLVFTFGTWYPRSKNYRFESISKSEFTLKCPVCGCENWLFEDVLEGMRFYAWNTS